MESSNSKNHHVEKSPLLKEVADLETQFLGMIHSSKVLWHSEVQLQYKKICSCYEKLLVLGDHKLEELQDVEYSLWKLHYRLIDEFRKRLRRIPDNGEPTAESVDGFKSFLSVASLYYQNLILNLRKNYGLQESFTLGSRNGGMQDKKLQFLWHRFLVCLGDLARYKEQQCEKSGQPNWSVPASQYLQATMVWPFNGNPHNQLAVLATYVGDEFLALYHCIRSLAVKEPFPDAWNNLLLLCEENRSSPLASISSDADFDFLKQASSGQMTSDCKVMKEQEEESSNGANLWVLIIRVISFFLIDSSLEEFPSTFASTIKELETLLSLDDTKLKATMESYHYMDSTRKEPFRTLQVVCILIFVIEHLKNRKEEVKESMQWALTSAFMIMGRLVDRCSKATPSSSCTLSPAVLIFIEWLETTFGDVEKYGSDDRTTVTIAISYFFSSLHELLKKLDVEKNEGDECEFNRPLWEDQELRGFAPLAPSFAALDFFSTHHRGPADSFESGKRIRACRIINAAKKISERSNGDQNWFTYDSCRQTIDAEEGIASVASTVNGTAVTDEKSSNHRANGKSAAGFLDEEEVILFKPLTRHNSEPIYKSSSDSFEDPMSPSREAGNQAVAADECLRRATSLLMAQYQAQGDNNNNGLPFHSDLTNFRRNNNFQQPMNDTLTSMFSEPSISPSFGSTIAAGPPSLNAWVSPSSFSHEKARGKTVKQTLAPIEEAVAASSSLRELSLSEPEENTATISGHSPYSSPLPSAPFLPDDDDDGATWLRNGNIPMLPPPHFSDHQQTSAGFSNWNGPPYDYTYYPPGFTYPAPQQQRRMTSAEWLRQYRENNPRANDHMWQPPSYASHVSPDQQWGIPPPLVYDHPLLMMQMGFPQVHGYLPSRQGLYGESPSLNEPEPLLQYLKEKEWLIHHKDSNFRGPSFMGS